MEKPMILAAGLQSGGTTLVSWCFLQHPDLDGELDMPSDRIMTTLGRVKAPVTWVKMTHYGFRWNEVAEVYRVLGYDPRPLLIVRNPFLAFASLKNKWYGWNAHTAEDPPLVVRFLRFFEDWQLFMDRGWPVLVFEDFLRRPEVVLGETCDRLGMSFHPDMLSWPKSVGDIAYVREMNSTFAARMKDGLTRGDDGHSGASAELTVRESNWIAGRLGRLIEHYGYAPCTIVDEKAADALSPRPFEGRRYSGFGSQRPFRSPTDVLEELSEVLSGKTVWVYGAGDVGSFALESLQSSGVAVQGMVDGDPALVGQRILGFTVQASDELPADSDVVVGSLGHSPAIVESLRMRGFPPDRIHPLRVPNA